MLAVGRVDSISVGERGMRTVILAGICSLVSVCATAEEPAKKAGGGVFAEQRAAIVAGFEPGGLYSEIKGDQRVEVLGALDRMETVLSRGTPIDKLPPGTKLALYNDQEIINTILTDAQEASREVCKRVRAVESRLKINECHTVAEWERRTEAGRELAARARGTAGLPGT